MKIPLKKFLIVILIFTGIYLLFKSYPFSDSPKDKEKSLQSQKIEKCFQKRLSGVLVSGSGRVISVLNDDIQGSKHQRFVLRLSSGQTILITHNIDLAPKINDLRKGDKVWFNGEYEWNSKGGVVHWTHRDPKGLHPDGWLKHDGEMYR